MKFRVIILSALIGAIVCGVIARVLPAPYETSLAFTIDQRPRQAPVDYDYGGYYSLRATELFGDTLISWFGTPAFVVEIYDAAGIPLAPGRADIAAAVDGFSAKKLSTQNVVIRFTTKDRASAQALAKAAADAVSRKTSALNQNDKGQSLFVVTASEPIISLAPIRPPVAGLVGLALGAFAGYAFLFWKETKKPRAVTA